MSLPSILIQSDLIVVLHRLGETVTNPALWEEELGENKPSEADILAEWEVLKQERLDEEQDNQSNLLEQLEDFMSSHGYTAAALFQRYRKYTRANELDSNLSWPKHEEIMTWGDNLEDLAAAAIAAGQTEVTFTPPAYSVADLKQEEILNPPLDGQGNPLPIQFMPSSKKASG